MDSTSKFYRLVSNRVPEENYQIEHGLTRSPTLLLDASSHLYKRVCASVGPSICPSVGPAFFSEHGKNKKINKNLNKNMKNE